MESTPKSAQTAGDIGWAFVPQYYNFVNKDPSKLHCFYTKQSTLTHSTEGEEVQPCFGQQAIHEKFMSLGFDDCKVFVYSVDAQPSAAGGIIIQVLGEMSNANGPWKRFAQTFFLAEQPNGYFVLNDVFRYLRPYKDEDEMEDYEPEHVPTANSADVVAADARGPASAAAAVTIPEASFAAVEHASSQTNAVLPAAVTETPAAPSSPEVQSSAPAPKINGFHDEPTPIPPPEPFPVQGVAPVAGESAELARGAEAVPAAAPAAPAAQPAEGLTSAPGGSVDESHVEIKPDAPLPTAQEAHGSDEQPTASTSTAPAPAKSEPAAPAAPKTWASLAAAGKTKWSGTALSSSQGVSSAPAATTSRPAALAERTNTASTSADRSGGDSSAIRERKPNTERYPPVESITSGSCFIKGVNENVDANVLFDTLTRMFGPVKELDIVRNKACAFLEFEKVDSARKAIKMSMPYQYGGQGGIPIGADDHIINIETKKQPGERGRLADAGPKRGFSGSGERTGERVSSGSKPGPSGSGGSYASSGRGRGDGERGERGTTRGRGRGASTRGASK